MRISTASDRVKVYTKTVSENLVTGSLKTKAMMRGVNWPLASCTASSKVEERKTMKVSIAAAKVPMTRRAASGERDDCQLICFSIMCSNQMVNSAAIMPTT